MNTLIQTLNAPLWQTVGMALVHFLWQGALILLLALSIARLLRLPYGNARCRLYTLAFVIMSLCPLLTYQYLRSNTVPNLPPLSVASSAAPLTLNNASPAAPDLPTTETTTTKGSHLQLTKPHPSWLPVFLLLWISGVGLLTTRFILAAYGATRLRRTAVPLNSPKLRAAVADLCEKLGMRRFGRVYLSEKIAQPLALGCLRPIVLLPARAITGLPEEAIFAALAHELAHVRRLDLLVNALQRVVETVLFFQPAIWILSRWIRQERELACDDLAVTATGERVAYAEMLESFAREASGPNAFAAAASSTRQGIILQRVRRVLGSEPPLAGSRWSLAGSMTVVAAVLVFASLGIHHTYAEAKEEQENAKALIGKWRIKNAIVEFKPGGRISIQDRGEDKEEGSWEVSGDMLFVNVPGKGEKGSLFLIEGDKMVVENEEFFRVKPIDPKKLVGEWVGSEMLITLSDKGTITLTEGKAGEYVIEADEIHFQMAGDDGVEKSRFRVDEEGLFIADAGQFTRDGDTAQRKGSILGRWKGKEGLIEFLPNGILYMSPTGKGHETGRYTVMDDCIIVSLKEGKTKTSPIEFLNEDTVVIDGKEHLVRKNTKKKPALSRKDQSQDQAHAEGHDQAHSHAENHESAPAEAHGEAPSHDDRQHSATVDSPLAPVPMDPRVALTAAEDAFASVAAATASPSILGTWVNDEFAIRFANDSRCTVARKSGNGGVEVSPGRYTQKGEFLFTKMGASKDVDEFSFKVDGSTLELRPHAGDNPDVFRLEAASTNPSDFEKQRLVARIELAAHSDFSSLYGADPASKPEPVEEPATGSMFTPTESTPDKFEPFNEGVREFNDARRDLSRLMGSHGAQHPEVIGKLDEVKFLLERCEEELKLLLEFGNLDEKTARILQIRVGLYEERLESQIHESMDRAAMREAEAKAIAREKEAKAKAIAREKEAKEARIQKASLAMQNLVVLDRVASEREAAIQKALESGIAKNHPDIKAHATVLEETAEQAKDIFEDSGLSQTEADGLRKNVKSRMLKSILGNAPKKDS